ncbi:YciI family protein [Rhodohalobacter sp. 614A]|uniref:YciI family protein n=1 Tax=Rhodohalobacter sp. 614A TaxID=2908649 RepID=UPI001F220351|nr:YciI family protein [Rhodohalobacter sp. 614A]
MKKLFLLLGLAFLIANCSGNDNQNTESSSMPKDSLETVFNEQLANEVGADDYGMRQYVMAFLKAGPNPSADSTQAMELQRAHLANIRRMAEDGDLVLAGPFMDRGDVRGIYVFNVKTVEEARELTETDPAIQAGALEMELHPWYGSAALMKINEIHEQISKQNP